MEDNMYKWFVAALKYHIDKKEISQVSLSKKTGISAQHLNAIYRQREMRGSGKPMRLRDDTKEAIARAFGYDAFSFTEFGKNLVEGIEPEKKITPGRVSSSPSNYIESSDVVIAAQELAYAVMKLSEQNKKSYSRMKMWREMFKLLPSPTLIIKDGVVIFQNEPSKVLGDVIGKPLCFSCAAKECPGSNCPLKRAIESNQEETIYTTIRDDYYKITATPAPYDGIDYIIVQATEINDR